MKELEERGQNPRSNGDGDSSIYVSFDSEDQRDFPPSSGTPEPDSLTLWHQRMGHLDIRRLRDAIKCGAVVGASVTSTVLPDRCVACIEAKLTRGSHLSKSASIPDTDRVGNDVNGAVKK